MNLKLTDVVKNLLIINVLFFLGSLFLLGEPSGYQQGNVIVWEYLGKNLLALFHFSSDYFEPYQIVTHFFMHADFGHLFFNMFGLIMFGPALESALGSKKFLIFYFICAFGATVLYTIIQSVEIYNFNNAAVASIPVLGASGAIYGILAGFATKFPNVKMGLLFLPIMLPAVYFILLLVGYDIISGITTFNSGTGGTAHFAHVGGAVIGFLLIKYWERHGNENRWR